MIVIPASAVGVQIIETNAGALLRVNDAAVSRVDGHVLDAAFVVEQHDIARSKGSPVASNTRAELRGLLRRRQDNPEPAKHEAHESPCIEARRRRTATPIRRSDIALRGFDQRL